MAGVRRFKWLSHLESLFKSSECKWHGLPFKMADPPVLNGLGVITTVNTMMCISVNYTGMSVLNYQR